VKTIGLLGGMSWESSAEYYRLVNEGVRDRLGGLHSAHCLMLSVDFAEIETMQQRGLWDEAASTLSRAARDLQRGGADFVVLCTNTMHKLADAIQAGISIPLLHIADATATAIRGQRLRRVGLLGTRFTMEEQFYRGRLAQRHGLEVLVPAEAERKLVHDVIYDELCRGVIRPESRAAYVQVMSGLASGGAEGIILGCTEITLLVGPDDSPIPVFDTTRLHAAAAVDLALAAEPAPPA
jgi:amino-acid racemase